MKNSSGRIRHVGIHAGSNTFWGAPKSGDHVKRQALYSSNYVVARLGRLQLAQSELLELRLYASGLGSTRWEIAGDHDESTRLMPQNSSVKRGR